MRPQVIELILALGALGFAAFALPLILAGFGIFRGLSHKKGFREPWTLGFLAAAAIAAALIFPGFADTISTCHDLRLRGELDPAFAQALGIDQTDQRIALLENNCGDFPYSVFS